MFWEWTKVVVGAVCVIGFAIFFMWIAILFIPLGY